MSLSLPSCSPRLQPPARPALHPRYPRPLMRTTRSLEVEFDMLNLVSGSFHLDVDV